MHVIKCFPGVDDRPRERASHLRQVCYGCIVVTLWLVESLSSTEVGAFAIEAFKRFQWL